MPIRERELSLWLLNINRLSGGFVLSDTLSAVFGWDLCTGGT